jgi:hypothetical protein
MLMFEAGMSRYGSGGMPVKLQGFTPGIGKHGFMDLVKDSEGNLNGLHSMQ